MGNNSVPKFIFRLSRFPVYRGSVLGRFYCINKIGNKEVGRKELRLYPCAHHVGMWGDGGLTPLDGVSS